MASVGLLPGKGVPAFAKLRWDSRNRTVAAATKAAPRMSRRLFAGSAMGQTLSASMPPRIASRKTSGGRGQPALTAPSCASGCDDMPRLGSRSGGSGQPPVKHRDADQLGDERADDVGPECDFGMKLIAPRK